VSVVSIESVTVGESAVEALVRVDPRFTRTSVSPLVEAALVDLLPGICRHSCENDSASSAVEELADTESAHLCEHIALELMAMAGSPRTLKGRTEWDFSTLGPGVFKVSIEYDHDLVAIAALDEASTLAAWLLTRSGPHPDVSQAVARLRELRSQSA
jgi:hypothetical protein